MRRGEEKTKLLAFQVDDLQSQIARKKGIEGQFKHVDIAFQKETKNLKVLKRQIEDLEKQSKEYELTNQKLKILRQQFSALKEKVQELNLERGKFLHEKMAIESRLKNKEKINQQYEELIKLEKQNEEENEKFREHSQILQELKGLEQLKNKLDEDISRINKISVCPICKRVMKKAEAGEISQHLKKEFEEKYGNNLKSLNKKLEQLDYDIQEHKTIQGQFKRLVDIRQEKQTLELAENNLKNVKTNLKRIHENFTKIKKEAGEITHDGKVLKDKLPKLEKANQEWQEKKNEEDILNQKIMELQNSLGGLKQEIVQIEKTEKELKKIEREQQDIQKEISEY